MTTCNMKSIWVSYQQNSLHSYVKQNRFRATIVQETLTSYDATMNMLDNKPKYISHIMQNASSRGHFHVLENFAFIISSFCSFFFMFYGLTIPDWTSRLHAYALLSHYHGMIKCDGAYYNA